MAEATPAWQDTSLSPRQRAEGLVEAMSVEQKIAQLHSTDEQGGRDSTAGLTTTTFTTTHP